MFGQASIPKQRIPLSQKTEKWGKECVDAFIDLSKFGLSERRSYLKSMYDYYNGVIDEEDYNYVLKPYGKTRSHFPSNEKLPYYKTYNRPIAWGEIKTSTRVHSNRSEL